MKELTTTLSSLEVAEMVGREHKEVLRDIRKIESHLGTESNSALSKYFSKTTYKDSTGRILPSYDLSKMGCELYSTRMTGEKGTQFAISYIEHFNKMENHIKSQQYRVPANDFEALEMMFRIQKGNREEVKQIKKDVYNIREIVSLETKDWRNDTNKVLNRIAQTLGGGMYHKDVRSEAYQLLETKGRCKLDQRVNNRKAKALANGSSKTAVQKISKLDVIGEEPRLIEIYISVIQKMAIKYGIDFNELEVI